MFCPNCGHKAGGNEKFCGQCGTPLGDAARVKKGGSSRLLKIIGIAGGVVLVVVIAALLIGRETPPATHPWPMHGCDAQWSFRSPYTGPEAAVIRWVISLPDILVPPLVGADGCIYFSEERDGIVVITALDADGNTRKMVRVAHENPFGDIGGLLLAPGPTVTLYVFCSAEDGMVLIALDAAKEELWRTHFDVYLHYLHLLFSTLGPDGTLYLTMFDEDDESVRLNALQDDGSQKWALALPGMRSNVAIALHGTIYVYQEDGRVYAYDSQGRKRWHSEVLPGKYEFCWLAVGPDDTLYVLALPADSREHPRVYALAASGNMKWHVDIPEPGELGLFIPAVGPDGEFYVHFRNETLHKIDKGGNLTSFATIPGHFNSSILVDSANNVYAGGPDFLYAFSPDGSLKWKLPISAEGSYLMMGADGTIYVAISNHESKLYAVSHPTAK